MDKEKRNNELFFVEHILTKKQKNRPDVVYVLKKSNDNTDIINIFKTFLRIEKSKNNHKLDSMKMSYHISDNPLNNSIFNNTEYGFLVSQKYVGIWDFEDFSHFFSQNKTQKKNEFYIKISKVIYTTNGNTALVQVQSNTSYYVVVFIKVKNTWVEKEIIFPMLF